MVILDITTQENEMTSKPLGEWLILNGWLFVLVVVRLTIIIPKGRYKMFELAVLAAYIYIFVPPRPHANSFYYINIDTY